MFTKPRIDVWCVAIFDINVTKELLENKWHTICISIDRKTEIGLQLCNHLGIESGKEWIFDDPNIDWGLVACSVQSVRQMENGMGAVNEVLDNMLYYPQSRSHVISICLRAFYIPPKIIICWATFIFKGDDLTFAHYIWWVTGCGNSWSHECLLSLSCESFVCCMSSKQNNCFHADSMYYFSTFPVLRQGFFSDDDSYTFSTGIRLGYDLHNLWCATRGAVWLLNEQCEICICMLAYHKRVHTQQCFHTYQVRFCLCVYMFVLYLLAWSIGYIDNVPYCSTFESWMQ